MKCSVLAPSYPLLPSFLHQLSRSILLHVFSYLDVGSSLSDLCQPLSVEYLGSAHPRLQQCLSEVKQGEESSRFPVDGTYIHLNETIAKQRVGEER